MGFVTHHAADEVACRRLVRLLEDALQQQGVLGQPLVRLGQHVGQLQPVTLLVGLGPLERGQTQTVRINSKPARTKIDIKRERYRERERERERYIHRF